MEFRELTSSIITFWGSGCAEHILRRKEYTTYIRQRNHWINSNLSQGLSGVFGIDWGRIIAFALEMPIEIAPLPILGENLSIIVCYWISPPIATPNHKKLLWEQVIERAKLRGFRGISFLCPMNTDLQLFESFGFSVVAESDCMSQKSLLLFLNLDAGKPPALKQPAPIKPPHKRPYAIDIFYPQFCPIGTLLLNRVLMQITRVASLVELRVHDTTTRKIVLKLGRTFGCLLNGTDIASKILGGISLKEILAQMERANH